MQAGKVPYNTMQRSIRKVITPRRPEVLRGVGIQNDCSVLKISDGALVVSKNPCVFLRENRISPYWLEAGFYRCFNDILAGGGDPFALEAVFLLSPDVEEESFRGWVRQLEELCKKENMEYSGGHTETISELSVPMAVLTIYGQSADRRKIEKTAFAAERRKQERAYWPKEGQSIVMTGYAGAETAALLAATFYQKLAGRFTEDFLQRSVSFLNYLCAAPEAAVARKHGVTSMHNISSGGVLGCLWEMTEGANLGMDVDLRSIPIRQDTIELCEIFELNPYQISSCGAMLMAADDGEQMAAELLEAGIPAAVIGRFEKGNRKLLRNGDEERFLDRPAQDEVQACLQKWYQK